MKPKCIGDYALIGDGETAALLGRDGAIEWLCFPRFDSEACCAAILGDKENGCWDFTLEGGVVESTRRYRGESLILETDLSSPTGTVRIIDFMPLRGQAPDVVRIVECIEGEVALASELRLRFDYGRIFPLVRHCSEDRSLAISGPDGVSLDFDDPITFDNRCFTTRCRLAQGERRRFVLTWFPSHEDAPRRVDPEEALEATETYWREWIGKVDYEGRYRDEVVRSLITLKAMIHRPTGGIIAAPTASLPEHLGGERNWDYRYCWLRDATFTLLALLRLGLTEEAEAWIEWLRRAVGGEPIDVRPFYTVTGQSRAIEWQAPWLEGFTGSQPVRFGNLAHEQLQLDVYGQVIDCLFQARAQGLAGGEECDELVRLVAEALAKVWEERDAGIWESRGPPLHHTYSKVMCWVAFDRASAWFEEKDADFASTFADLAQRARARVLAEGWSEKRGAFTGAFGDHALDAALLLLPELGFLLADDPRMAATIAAIEKGLMEEGLVRRYDPEETDDGFDCDEGAFVAAGFWLVEAMAMQGRQDDAQALFDRLLGRANDLGLLAEELEIGGARQLGNFPQALSHLALVRAACRLDGIGGLDCLGGCGERD